MKIIDVSQWQGVIDWEQVKGNVDGVILRAGYGSKGKADTQFARNAAECNRLGIPIGAYWFSYAKSVDEAKREAGHLLAAVKPYRMELPLAYDFEYDSVSNAEAQGVKITKALATSFAEAFCDAIEKGGYWVLNYTNLDYLQRMFDAKLTERYGLWLAAWKLSSNPDLSNPPRKCDIWQWGGSQVPGIGGSVDTNECYRDFPALIKKAGLNHLRDDDPVAWAKKLGLIEGDTDVDKTVAKALWCYHSIFTPEDDKTVSGLLT